MRIIEIGTKEKFPKNKNTEIRIVNLISVIIGSIIALPFVIISLIFAPSLAIFPALGTVICAVAIGLNAIGGFKIAKFTIGILPTYLVFFYHLGAVNEGESLIPSVIIIQSFFTLVPFIVISLEEFFFLFSTVFIVFLSVFFLQESVPLLTMDVDASFLREGWFSKVILFISIITGFSIVFAFSLMNKNAKEEINKTLSENELKSAEIKESEKILKEKVNELVAYQEKEKNRNWAVEGIAEFAKILRNNNEDLEKLSDSIISTIIQYLNANQGAVFILNDESENHFMELKGMYAYDRRKFLDKKIELGEGLVGECWRERENIYLTDVPRSYINITSGLGEAVPNCVFIVPLKINNKVYGVIELASFNVFTDFEIEYVEKISESIASTLGSVKQRIKTNYLLEEAQQMSEEMKEQEEELRQNTEEMQATQEEMERTVQNLEKLLAEK